MDGQRAEEELQVADTRIDEVMASARPGPTGWRLEKVPFYFTEEASRAFTELLDAPGPRPGSLLGTLTPDFRYIPKSSELPHPPGLPG